MELYKRLRPKKFGEVWGQDEAVASLTEYIRDRSLPHTVAFIGPSGTGKTTLARILVKKLNCGPRDFYEVNAASARGVDTIRGVEQAMRLAPWSGDCRIWLFDEAHQLTGDAQDALLKITEDTPRHVYFFLATTTPHKVHKTLMSRCCHIKTNPVAKPSMKEFLGKVVAREKLPKPHAGLLDAIADSAEGSLRTALVILDKAIRLKGDQQLRAAYAGGNSPEVNRLVPLLFTPKIPWREVSKVLRTLDGEENAESIRHRVLGYGAAVLLGGGPKASWAEKVMICFLDNFYETKMAGLKLSCWQAVGAKS